MKVVVVTGGIGAGKSVVADILHEMTGCGVYDADSKVKELYVRHPGLLSDIERALGITLRDSDGRFMPQKLAQVIFSDRNALEEVESRVFPALKEDFRQWASEQEDGPFVVLESATILEKPQMAGLADKVILVSAPSQTRLERACERDGASEDRIRARMENQQLMNAVSDGNARLPHVELLVNDGSIEDLEVKVKALLDRILID